MINFDTKHYILILHQGTKEKLLGVDVDARSDNSDNSSTFAPRKYCLTFDGLDPDPVYKLTFSTEIDGMTITQTIRKFDCEES